MVWDLEGQVRATHCASGISRAGGVWGPVGNPVGVAAARVSATPGDRDINVYLTQRHPNSDPPGGASALHLPRRP